MAKKEKEIKTNVMRLLDRAGIAYDAREYAYSEDDLSGVHAAAVLGLPCEKVFKTLVLHGDKSGYFVCCIPVDQEIDLKKAAVISGNKKAEMLHVKELLPLTGYLRGGCSPIGMKKQFPTYIDASAESKEQIGISGGQRGVQVLLSPEELKTYIRAEYAELI
ncbi:MAG: Cys-tRNA(Pro) deacylase [Eubacteriales bacterium]|nr:Cys-tRNA(Pro) deacylase [Eubacteriales bacterium]